MEMLLLLTYFIVFGIMALATLSVIADNAEHFVHDMFGYCILNLTLLVMIQSVKIFEEILKNIHHLD